MRFALPMLMPVMVAGALLGGCSTVSMIPTPWVDNAPLYPPYEGVGFTAKDPTERERLIARGGFSVEVVRFSDERLPRLTAERPADNLIYQYEPGQLMGGLTYRMPVLFNKYLAYRPKAPKHYRAELELVRMFTEIRPGSFFYGGSMGKYVVTMEVRALVRRNDSRVALDKTYTIDIEQRRETFNGRSPSAEMDRSRMYDMAEMAVRQASEQIGWDIRMKDARYWNPARDVPPAPARLERVTPAPAIMPAPEVKEPTVPVPEEDGPVFIVPSDIRAGN